MSVDQRLRAGFTRSADGVTTDPVTAYSVAGPGARRRTRVVRTVQVGMVAAAVAVAVVLTLRRSPAGSSAGPSRP